PPAEEMAEPEAMLAIPAAAFGQTEGAGLFEWTALGSLGQWDAAPLALPQGQPPTSVEDGVFLEYPVMLTEAGEYALDIHLVPTLDTIGTGEQRFAVQIDDGPAQTITIELVPTGEGAHTP